MMTAILPRSLASDKSNLSGDEWNAEHSSVEFTERVRLVISIQSLLPLPCHLCTFYDVTEFGIRNIPTSSAKSTVRIHVYS